MYTTVLSLQINECQFWNVMDDEPIARVLSYHPKMIDNMRFPCDNERKTILVRRSKAILEARIAAKKRLHFPKVTEKKRSISVSDATVDNKRYVTVNDPYRGEMKFVIKCPLTHT
jgi:hypothetical protein